MSGKVKKRKEPPISYRERMYCIAWRSVSARSQRGKAMDCIHGRTGGCRKIAADRKAVYVMTAEDICDTAQRAADYCCEDSDMQKAISDMHKDRILLCYQYFVESVSYEDFDRKIS